MNHHFFLALIGFIALPTLLSRLCRIDKIFPLVFVQLIVGLLMQSSGALAWLARHDMNLTTGPLADSLNGLGWLGICLLIALTGSESAPRGGDGKAWQFIPVSVVGFSGTCLIGSAVGYALALRYPSLLGPNADIGLFSFAIGLALSVTALPVLVSILRETGLAGSTIGNLATNSAMLDDLWMWVGLAVILSLSNGSGAHPAGLLAALALYLVVMIGPVRYLLRRWCLAAAGRSASDRIIVAVSLVFLSAVCTDYIGLHPMLGTFVAGAILPREVLADWRDSLLHFSHIMLLPFFFIMTGLRLSIEVQGQSLIELTLIVTAAAVLSKFFSISAVARVLGHSWRSSFALGSLMQCKGLMELVAINILLDGGIISGPIFSALAIMALLSTLITAPLMKGMLGAPAPVAPLSGVPAQTP
ncbi:cation:proton antiporter [Massilia sp. PAMC28688]|uniref:cation:proton antiporter n=1 Tax=Massilia sp. PAMC28688 TaxID=2861283 RepID=UPI001E45338B|nr:cation:proton antiporter [Massilia sp. PAMC28688]